jgi:hypothetical protein
MQFNFMNTMKKLSIRTSSVAIASLLALAPLAAFAQTASVTATTSAATVSVTAGATTGVKGTASLSTLISKGDSAIATRITALTDLSTRIGEMKNISASEKTSLQANISTEIGNLTGLKATIDAATSKATLVTDLKTITSDYRIYLLILPQGRIAAASDRIGTIVSLMQQLSPKLSARITAAQTAGVNVSAAQSAYTDMQTQITAANTASQAALSETISLAPDQGNTTVQASNTAAIKDAAAKIKTATADLKAARADIGTILSAVKGARGASVTASTSVQ